jgi:hypothetical protein
MNVARLISLLFGFVCAVVDAVLVLICSAGGHSGPRRLSLFFGSNRGFSPEKLGLSESRLRCWALWLLG